MSDQHSWKDIMKIKFNTHVVERGKICTFLILALLQHIIRDANRDSLLYHCPSQGSEAMPVQLSVILSFHFYFTETQIYFAPRESYYSLK
jgi:hypothetical protein